MNLQLIKLQLLLKRNGIERANFLKKKNLFDAWSALLLASVFNSFRAVSDENPRQCHDCI